MKCWGNNGSGQLGDGTPTNRDTPVDVTGLRSGVESISAGGGYTCAVATGVGATCWGGNRFGQLGDGTTKERHRPVDVTRLTTGVAAVAGGGYHTCAVTTGGGAKCWGLNVFGQLGDGTTKVRHTPVNVIGLRGV